jgi:hypothetical protein
VLTERFIWTCSSLFLIGLFSLVLSAKNALLIYCTE